MPDDRQINRRRFFLESFRELIKPLSESLESAAREIGAIEANQPDVSIQTWLRPPGALSLPLFLETCSRCAACVRVCPVQCIKIDSTGEKGDGAPFIEADVTACAVCDGLYCMPACPTGALQLKSLSQIKMGTAVWHRETCVRKHGEDCKVCVDHCPIGSYAIELTGNDVTVHEKGCIGCGICQHDCPTSPKSITVTPTN